MFIRSLPLALIAVGCVSACGPDDNESDAVADVFEVSPETDASLAPDEVSAACNALTVLGPEVALTGVAGSAPIPHGGTIADGTYFLTAAKMYGDSLAFASQQTVVDGHGEFQFLVFNSDIDEAPIHSTLTYATHGTSLTMTQTCPSLHEPDLTSFDATPTEFTFYSSDGTRTVSQTYTKQ